MSKPKDITSQTIFCDVENHTGPNFQRRIGFFYDHGVNAGAVASEAKVFLMGTDDEPRARIEFYAIVPKTSQWDGQIPESYYCEHGGETHSVVKRERLDVPLSEVEL